MNILKAHISFVISILFMLISLITHAQDYGRSISDASQRLNAIQKSNSQITSIKADFTLVKRIAILAEPEKGYGKMTYDKSTDRLELVNTEPKDNAIILEGNNISLITKGQSTTIGAQQNPGISQMISMFKSSITGDFLVLGSKSKIAYYENDKLFTIVITPTSGRIKKYIRQIVLRFNSDNSLAVMRIDEGSDDYSEYVFTNQIITRKQL